MRPIIRPVMVAACLCIGGGTAIAKTTLDRLTAELPDTARMSWEEGVRAGRSETYEGFRLSGPAGAVNIDRLDIEPASSGLRMTATGLTASSRSGRSLTAERIVTTASDGLLARAVSGRVPTDFCEIGAVTSTMTVTRGRVILPDSASGSDTAALIARAGKMTATQSATAAGDGCIAETRLDIDGLDMRRGDDAGLSTDRIETVLRMPGSLASLAAGVTESVTLDQDVSGMTLFAPDGAPAILADSVMAGVDIEARSLAPLLTSLLRSSRDGLSRADLPALWDAAIEAGANARTEAENIVLRAPNILPTGYATSLGDAGLNNVIGTYAFDAELADGGMLARLDANLVGVSESRLEARFRLNGMDAPADDWPVHLDTLRLVHRDAGLLDAFEQVTGSPVSVMLSILRDTRLQDYPEDVRSALSAAATGTARFFRMSRGDAPALLEVAVTPELSIGEVIRLLQVRTDLVDEMFTTRIRTAGTEDDT